MPVKTAPVKRPKKKKKRPWFPEQPKNKTQKSKKKKGKARANQEPKLEEPTPRIDRLVADLNKIKKLALERAKEVKQGKRKDFFEEGELAKEIKRIARRYRKEGIDNRIAGRLVKEAVEEAGKEFREEAMPKKKFREADMKKIWKEAEGIMQKLKTAKLPGGMPGQAALLAERHGITLTEAWNALLRASKKQN